jgi:hypothetical protein
VGISGVGPASTTSRGASAIAEILRTVLRTVLAVGGDRRDHRGASAVEYCLLGALIAVGITIAVLAVGPWVLDALAIEL